MLFGSLHPIDILMVLAYLAAVVWSGRWAAAGNEEVFFVAGRKLGKLYQFFLNFGNATERQGAVSTATRCNPGRFDDTKLLGRNSWWEFCRWDKADTIGFIVCCALSGSIVGLFVMLLRWGSAV